MARRPSHDAAQLLFEHGVNLAARSIHLSGDIDCDSVTQFIRGLELLLGTNPEQVTVYITSPGGEVEAGFAIYDVISALDVHVTTVALGSAQSMGAIILLAGDRRLVSANATVMFHNPTLITEAESHSFEAWGTWSSVVRSRFTEILAERSTRSKSYWRSKLKADAIFTAEQTVAHGLAHAIMTTFGKEPK